MAEHQSGLHDADRRRPHPEAPRAILFAGSAGGGVEHERGEPEIVDQGRTEDTRYADQALLGAAPDLTPVRRIRIRCAPGDGRGRPKGPAPIARVTAEDRVRPRDPRVEP